MEVEISVENYLKMNVLAFFQTVKFLIGDNPFDWDWLNKLHEENIKERLIKIEKEGQDSLKDNTNNLYDLILLVKKGDKQAIRFLDFMNKVVAHLSTRLTKEEKRIVTNSSLINMLIAVDHNYLCFFGELAVLNNIMETGKYRLLNVDFKHTAENKKDIDFRLKDVNDNSIYLVEVVNILLNDDKVESEAINTFITDRVVKKISLKNKNVTQKVEFELIPVIWGSAASLKIYSEYFKNNKIDVPNVHEPISYSSFFYESDESKFVGNFKSISRLFDY